MAVLFLEPYWPLGTVAVWWGLSIYQAHRDRYRTWTERFFLAGCLFIGAYALADVFFFTVPTEESAKIAGLIGFSVLTLAVLFMFLFALVFYTRMRRAYLLTLLPAVGLILMVWLYLTNDLTGLGGAGTEGPPWVGDWSRNVFLIWVGGSLAYAALAAYFLFRTYREIALQTSQLRRRMLGLLVSSLITIAFGGLTNTLRGYFGSQFGFQVLPLFSTALLLPGIVAFVTLSPMSTDRFSVAVRRWKANRYDIKAAFVIYMDGTLIGAKVLPGEKVIDQDLFGATLDVIQNFMRTSFPAFHGALSEIKLGEDILVVERGHYAYVTVVLHGEVNDQLRRHMRDLLLEYEHNNQPVLADWRGMPSEAIGTDALLGSLIEKT